MTETAKHKGGRPFLCCRLRRFLFCTWTIFLQVSEKIQTNTERLGYCAELWDDLKALECDINQWTAASVTDLTGSVATLGDVESAEALLATFQVRAHQVAMIEMFNEVTVDVV